MTFLPAVFKFAYSLAVALLFVLAIIMGTRTFYEEPEPPPYPSYPRFGGNLECDFPNLECVRFGKELQREIRLSLDEARASDPDQFRAVERQFQLQTEFDAAQLSYHDDQVERARNVLLMVSISGVVAIAAGLYLFSRVEAMPLGLMLGGLGVVIYGWVESRQEMEEIAAAPVFAAAAVGFVVVLASGYWLLRPRSANGEH